MGDTSLDSPAPNKKRSQSNSPLSVFQEPSSIEPKKFKSASPESKKARSPLSSPHTPTLAAVPTTPVPQTKVHQQPSQSTPIRTPVLALTPKVATPSQVNQRPSLTLSQSHATPPTSFGFSSFAKATASFASLKNQTSIFSSTPPDEKHAAHEAKLDGGVHDRPDPPKARPLETLVVTSTGEESEETMYSVRAKLYIDDNDGYKERGIGTLKINVRDDEEDKRKARIVMRSEHTYKVLLNCHLLPGMRCVVTDNYVRFIAIEGTRLITYLFKVANHKTAHELGSEILLFTEKISDFEKQPAAAAAGCENEDSKKIIETNKTPSDNGVV